MQQTVNKVVSAPTLQRREPRRHGSLAPWLWIAPAVLFVTIFLVYPLLNTVYISFYNRDSTQFVGFKNYQFIFSNAGMLEVLRNNVIWLVLGTLGTVGLGLLIAVLVDRVRFESVAKAAIFVPMAISFVGAGVIWRFVYNYNNPGQPQTGLLNGIITFFGGQPQAWLVHSGWNTIALIAVYVWMWTGFCMVILSASLKGIPADIMEAARTDGANELTIFFRIIVPLISPTVVVVGTTMIINILKIFDVVYVMTGGQYGTNVIAAEFYRQLFNFNNYGIASALTVLLLIVVIPITIINVNRFRAQEAHR